MKLLPIIIASSCLLFAAHNSRATTAWGQGFFADTKPVELVLRIENRGQFLLYGLGPTLRELGVRNRVIPNPKIQLYRLDQNGQRKLIDSNDNWRQHSSRDAIESAQDDLGVSFSPNEAAMVKQLNPGRYVLVVTNAVRGRMGFTAAGATTWAGDFKPEPPANGGDVEAGLWVAQDGNSYDLCFNVSADGTFLTQAGSECRSGFGDRESLFIGFIQVEGGCDEFVDNIDLDRNIPIVDNAFRVDIDLDTLPVLPPLGIIVEGTFDDGVLRGTVTQRVGSSRCSGDFIARPQ